MDIAKIFPFWTPSVLLRISHSVTSSLRKELFFGCKPELARLDKFYILCVRPLCFPLLDYDWGELFPQVFCKLNDGPSSVNVLPITARMACLKSCL